MPKLDSYDPEVDVLIGDRIRARRVELGFSQADLASMIGMSFQQVQKYERGANRIASSILLRVASALDYPAGHFLDIGKQRKPKKQPPQTAAERDISQLFQRLRQVKSAKARGRITLVLDALLREVEGAAAKSSPRRRITATAPKTRKPKPAPARSRKTR